MRKVPVLPRPALLFLTLGALIGMSTQAESGRAGALNASRASLAPPVGAANGGARGNLVTRWSESSPGRSRLEIDLTGLRRNSTYTIRWDDPATADRTTETIATVRTRNARRARLALGARSRHRLPAGVTLADLAGGRIEVRDQAGRLVLSGEAPVLAQELAEPVACRFIEEVVLEDLFDTGTIGATPVDWDFGGLGTGLVIALDDTVFDGDAGNSVQFTDTVATDPGAVSMSRAFPAQTAFFSVEFTMITAAATTPRLVCRVSDSTATPPALPTGFGDGLGLYEDGTIGFAIGDTIATAAPSTQYHFRVDFDIAAQTFDVAIDGTTVVTARALGLATTSLDRIEFAGDSTAVGVAYVDTVRVINRVQDCPPTANAGPDQVVECSAEGAPVVLDGSASADPEGAALTYKWTGDFVEATAEGVNPTVHFAGPGPHTATLVVNDGFFDSAPDDVAIESQDTTPPELRVEGLPATLWPPNHKMIQLAPTVTVGDGCVGADGVTVTLEIHSNEADNGLGDGNTSGDTFVRSPSDFDLRAERSGPGSGRVYTLVWTATDTSGNTVTHEAVVRVPHDQGHHGGGDDGDDDDDDGADDDGTDDQGPGDNGTNTGDDDDDDDDNGGNATGNSNANGNGNGHGRGHAWGRHKHGRRGHGRGRGR